MIIQATNNNSFEAKRFRLPVREIDLTNPELLQFGRQIKKVNLVKEYSNPEAENLYNKAMKSDTIKEKLQLLSKMGDYELYDFGDGLLGKFRMKCYLAITKITDLFD